MQKQGLKKLNYKKTNPDNEFNTAIEALTQMNSNKTQKENIIMQNIDIEENGK